MPNPEQFAQMKQQAEQQMQDMGQQIQQLTQENQAIKSDAESTKIQAAHKSLQADVKLANASFDQRDAESQQMEEGQPMSKPSAQPAQAQRIVIGSLAQENMDAVVEAVEQTQMQQAETNARLDQLAAMVEQLAIPKVKTVEIIGPSGQVYRGRSEEQ